MTSSILLGTPKEHKIVCAAARACKFRHSYDAVIYVHREIKDLRLQIHDDAAHFCDIEGIITQVEFDDLTDRFPDHPGAIAVLRELSILMPTFLYRNNAASLDNLRPPKPLSEYLLELEK